MAGGRPTSYNETIVPKTIEYIDSCVDDLEKKKVNIPTIEGLAIYLGIHRDTIYEWVSKYPEFSDIFEKVKQEQANRLLNNGLAGTYNSTIAKMILSGKHGYIEKTESDVTSKGESLSPILVKFIDAKDNRNPD